MTSPVSAYQLVQLADLNIRNARRRTLPKIESLWLCLQSAILLETALNKIDSDKYNNSTTEGSVRSKLIDAKNEIQSNLRALLDGENITEKSLNDWMFETLEFFREKFSNKENELTSINENKQLSSFGRKTKEVSVNSSNQSETIAPRSGSVQDSISYQRMLMKFSTPTAAKYGVNVLDPKCQKTILDYRNANSMEMSETSRMSETFGSDAVNTAVDIQPTIQRRSVISSRAARPTSLNLRRTTSTSSISSRISSLVTDLKTKAERLRRRNSVASPVVPWQTAIKQHNSMISEILNDIHVEPNDQTSDNEDLPPPENFLDRNGDFLISRQINSVQLSCTSKTITRQYFENGREIYSQRLDSNGNRHEIYRRSSLLDNDVKVTYARSGTLTPSSDFSPVPKVIRRAYSLHSFEPVSPLTETCSMSFEDFSTETPTKESPNAVCISENDILQALAHAILELAKRNFEDHHYEKAQKLYEQGLSVLNRMYKFSGKFEPAIIPTLKQCGLIRKQRGDSLGAMGIFEQCINVIEKRENGHCNTEYKVMIAELWFEMGNAMIIEGKHSETVGHAVISVIKERETSDFLDAPRSVASDMDLEYCYNAFTTKGQSYPVSAFEALACYQKAYWRIESLKSDDQEPEFYELSAKVLLKIGDCSVLIGDLEVGTNFYENALECFKATDTPYSLVDNAHVLVMIGFLHYVNGRYSKALVMLQCATIMFHRMENNDEPYEKVEFALVKSLSCFTHFEMGDYSKAVSMGIQAKRQYEDLFGDELPLCNQSYAWIVSQTIFILAKAHFSLNMFQQAIDTVQEIDTVFGSSKSVDSVLRVRVFELIGLSYESLEEPSKALEMYNKALEIYKNESNLGYTSSALEHSLLSRTAALHVTMQHYDEAAMCMDRSYASRDLEEDIRSDMVTLLHHLGETHTLAGHVDRAIDCYIECVDVYIEIHGKLGADIVKTLGKLANMHHVNAVQNNNNKDSIFEAEKIYRQAMDLDFSPVLALRYANFLFCQKSYLEAIYILQQLVDADLNDIVFAGVEQALLPALLQAECDEDELVVPGQLLVMYLLVLSFMAIGKTASAEYYVLQMIYELEENDTLSLSVIGYSLLEFRFYMEAYHWFDLADRLSIYPASVAWENKLFCVALELFRCLQRGVTFMYEYVHGLGSFPSSLPFNP